MRNTFLDNFAYFMMKMAKFFLKLAIFCVVIYLIGIRLFDFGHRLFYERAVDKDDTTEIVFEVKSNDDAETIAERLKEVGLIDDELSFKFRSIIYKTKFTPNVYNLKKSMTIKNMLDIFDKPSEENIAVMLPTDSVYEVGDDGDEGYEPEETIEGGNE